MLESKKEKTVSSGSIIQEAISIAMKENDYGLRLLGLRDICQALSKAGEIERALVPHILKTSIKNKNI